MAYKGFCRRCGNPHKELRLDTSGRALNSSHRSCFGPEPMNPVLTEKQNAILNGTAENPRKTHVVRLINKLEYFERFDDAVKVYDLYGYMFHEIHEGDLSSEEAANILDALTPGDLK